MSNVSQIYGTLRDSESYIILNSMETEVSGNLSVLQNLDVCGNITFNNIDLSTTLSNLVVDLTGGQDASFNNVEITGILDAGTNGTIKAANFNVGSKNVIDGSAGVSCTALEVKNQSNYICLMAQDSQVNISGTLLLNNVDVSGKLTQIDASLVDLASNGGGGTTIQTNDGFVANYSGNTAGSSSVALLTTTGLTNQGVEAVAIGAHAGANSQDRGCIAIGLASGRYNQGFGAISVGWDSGRTDQSQYSVALGNNAGKTDLGTNSIAIGRNASNSNPNGFNNYIVLNGTGSALDPQKSNAFFVKPIQSATNSNKLLYDSGTGEITYQTDYDASFTNVEISGNLTLNNVDVSGKLTQIDASLVDLASGGGGGSTTFDNVTNSGTYGSKIYLNSGSTNGVHGTWRNEYCHIQGWKSTPGTGAIGFYHDEMSGLNGAGTIVQTFYMNWGGPPVVISGQSNSSDDRIKHNEETIKNGLEIIRQLVPEKYIKGKSINDANAFPEAGFIAQKVLDISDINFAVIQTNKEFIEGDPSSCLYALDYNSIFTYSVAAIKELDNIVKELSNNLLVANQEILSLKEENILIKQKLNSLLAPDQQI